MSEWMGAHESTDWANAASNRVSERVSELSEDKTSNQSKLFRHKMLTYKSQLHN